MKPRETQVSLTVVIPIKDRSGNVVGEKEVASYAGLLSRAHEEGLKAITTTLAQIPTKDNGMVAIATATVETQRGRFTGIGDASPTNVNARIAPHLVRMAETRAKARALRDAVNIGMVALEELGPDVGDEVADEPGVRPLRPSTGTDNVTRLPVRTAPAAAPSSDTGTGPRGAQSAPARPSETAGGSPVNAAGSSPGHTGTGAGGSFIRATEPQRRLLFRLVAEEGYDGEGTETELCRRASVRTIAEISKARASQLIEAMKTTRDNGASHA